MSSEVVVLALKITSLGPSLGIIFTKEAIAPIKVEDGGCRIRVQIELRARFTRYFRRRLRYDAP